MSHGGSQGGSLRLSTGNHTISELLTEGKGFLTRAFEEGGLVSQVIPNFEVRPEQKDMALLVWEALCEPCHLIVEAGTGVGKSLAYLLPLGLWASATHKRAVISTHTVNLQQQLCEKDIPLVASLFKASGFNLRYNLFKGRGHYLCLRRFSSVYDEIQGKLIPLDADDQAIARLDSVVREGGWDGDREHLNFSISDNSWNMVSSESDRCMGNKCRFKEKCFYQQVRRELEKSHLIIVNHALFMAHTKLARESKNKVNLLPPFDAVIFDESHHIEEQARNSLSVEVTLRRLKRLLDDTLRTASSGTLKQALSSHEVKNIKDFLQDRQEAFSDIMRKFDPEKNSSIFAIDEKTGETLGQIVKKGTIGQDFIDSLRELAQTISDWGDYNLSDEEHFEVESLVRRYLDLADTLEDIDNLEGQGETKVYWAEKEGGKREPLVSLRSSPLDVGPYLKEEVWSKIQSIVLTSATLSTGNSFSYVKRMLALDGETNLREKIIGSPFNYSEQAFLCVPDDEEGMNPNAARFNLYVAKKLPQIIAMAHGRTFVLFTARKSMEEVCHLCRDKIEELGYPVLVQGEASRETLLRDFKSLGNAVLFGLDSFWEGVDVQGEALSCVVVVKLPFPVPTDPCVKAREELYKKRGMNPFQEHSLPVATLKLKQGFGRLIRSKTDKGAVIMLDGRILRKPYGQFILKSLPPARLTTDLEEAMKAVPGPSKPSGTATGPRKPAY